MLGFLAARGFARKSKELLRQVLSKEQWAVTQEAATERPFMNEYYNHWEKGGYQCVCCGVLLFRAEKKFESGCGWPSFTADEGLVTRHVDRSYGMERVETRCECGAHLGHVFQDGPPPTGERHCVNSASLWFEKED